MIDLAIDAINGDACCSYERAVRTVAGLDAKERARFWSLVTQIQEAAQSYGQDSPAYAAYIRQLRKR